MERLLPLLGIFRNWPRWAHHLGAALIIAVAFACEWWVWPQLQVYPFFLFFPAILLSAAVFEHGSGYLATALSAPLLALILDPVDSFGIAQTRDWVALTVFVAIGLLQSALVELLRKALLRAQAAEARTDLFLREAVHRFKNDMTIVTALLRLQERQVAEGPARTALANTANRVHAMSRVHDRLQLDAADAAVVNADAFIAALCDDLKAALVELRPIAIRLDAEPHALSHSRAVAVGLIINEALTNALKYAFPDGRAGTVSVSFGRIGDRLVLQVVDDGIGAASGPDPKTGGLGRRLIQSMAQQIDGTLTVEPGADGRGMAMVVTFPLGEERR